MLIAGSCAPLQMYPGNRLPPDQISTVNTDVGDYSTGRARYAEIVSVDGEKISKGSIEIVPGVHKIQFEERWSNGGGKIKPN